MFYAILPQYTISLTEQEMGDLLEPFRNISLTGPYSTMSELREKVLPIIVKLINSDIEMTDNIDDWMAQHKTSVAEEEATAGEKKAPAETPSRGIKRSKGGYQPSELVEFLLGHTMITDADGYQLVMSTYDDLERFSDLYACEIEGDAKFIPMIFSSGNDGEIQPMKRVYDEDEELDEPENKKQKTEEEEEEAEEAEDVE